MSRCGSRCSAGRRGSTSCGDAATGYRFKGPQLNTAGNRAVVLENVSVERQGNRSRLGILRDIDWVIGDRESWIIMGPNGSGKSTLSAIIAGRLGPTRGLVTILGSRLGSVDVRALRGRIGYMSSALSARLRPELLVRDVVITGADGALEPWWSQYSDEDSGRAMSLLEQFECGHIADRLLSTLSDGERQRVLLARTLMAAPELVVLDEPNAGLDLGARESLVQLLSQLAKSTAAPLVLVTHHLEEIPAGFGRALLLKCGRVVGAGRIDEVITDENLSTCYGIELHVEKRCNRWTGWTAPHTDVDLSLNRLS